MGVRFWVWVLLIVIYHFTLVHRAWLLQQEKFPNLHCSGCKAVKTSIWQQSSLSEQETGDKMSSTQDLHPSKDTKEQKNLNSKNTRLAHRRGKTQQEGRKKIPWDLLDRTDVSVRGEELWGPCFLASHMSIALTLLTLQKHFGCTPNNTHHHNHTQNPS
jgi:hypothetical protein